ncbi:hypothetical protein Hanom_Chr15g01381851 [Helianthus anomalus]
MDTSVDSQQWLCMGSRVAKARLGESGYPSASMDTLKTRMPIHKQVVQSTSRREPSSFGMS